MVLLLSYFSDLETNRIPDLFPKKTGRRSDEQRVLTFNELRLQDELNKYHKVLQKRRVYRFVINCIIRLSIGFFIHIDSLKGKAKRH
jgi:hypothetical protein